ncbi:hypothetical protein ACIQV3_08430 [Streptomyces sp. NPDC099050]|uniref:hypothetical protein n=1 Tax=Streptomyces sp. NPDC099050 TaxID=3366100 RepID=UPI00381B9992
MSSEDFIEYRIEHLRDRLARDDIAELGLRIDMHGAHAVLRGSVCSDACRAAVLRAAAEEFEGVPWRADLTVNRPHLSPRPEELS